MATGRMNFCGNDTDEQLTRKFLATHSGTPNGHSDSELERISRQWQRLRKLAVAGRLGGTQSQG